jgi:putative endonuclease
MYDVYILKSETTRRYYTGSTANVHRRLREHNDELPNPGLSTRGGRPWKLVFRASYPSRAGALAAERYIKSMKSRSWIGKLVDGRYQLPDF